MGTQKKAFVALQKLESEIYFTQSDIKYSEENLKFFLGQVKHYLCCQKRKAKSSNQTPLKSSNSVSSGPVILLLIHLWKYPTSKQPLIPCAYSTTIVGIIIIVFQNEFGKQNKDSSPTDSILLEAGAVGRSFC